MRIWVLCAATLVLAWRAEAQPAISPGGIVNASSYLPKLSPGVVFLVFGSKVGPDALVAATAPDYPFTLGGTSINVTPAGGGAAIDARVVYTSVGQVAGLLPSSVTPGSYMMRVTYGGQTSPPAAVTVLPRAFGIAAANGGG